MPDYVYWRMQWQLFKRTSCIETTITPVRSTFFRSLEPTRVEDKRLRRWRAAAVTNSQNELRKVFAPAAVTQLPGAQGKQAAVPNRMALADTAS
jgi:hypothetical protein